MPILLNMLRISAVVGAMTLGVAIVGAQRVTLDGETVDFDVKPQMLNGRLMVPMRGIFEKMGINIEWMPERELVTAKRGADVVELWLNSREARINGKKELMEQAPFVYRGRTMVPLRLIAQATGSTVSYVNGEVQITSPRDRRRS